MVIARLSRALWHTHSLFCFVFLKVAMMFYLGQETNMLQKDPLTPFNFLAQQGTKKLLVPFSEVNEIFNTLKLITRIVISLNAAVI